MTGSVNIETNAVVSVDLETTQRLVTELREARAERDRLRALDDSLGADKWLPELNRAERERTAAQEQLAQVTAERDDLAQKLSGRWIEREVDARVLIEAKSGPVAFERNQLRDEVAELRAKLAAIVPCTGAHCVANDEHQRVVNEYERLAQANFGLTHQLMLAKRDLNDSERAVQILSTMFRAAISAVAKGAP